MGSKLVEQIEGQGEHQSGRAASWECRLTDLLIGHLDLGERWSDRPDPPSLDSISVFDRRGLTGILTVVLQAENDFEIPKASSAVAMQMPSLIRLTRLPTLRAPRASRFASRLHAPNVYTKSATLRLTI